VTEARARGSRARTVFFGSGPFGLGPLRRLVDHPRVDLVGVVTAPPRPAGRARTLTPTPIADAARELKVEPILEPARLRTPEAVAEVLAQGPELAVLADYGQLVPAPILELPLGALNLHPSLLPRHRGATPIPATILAGDDETGVTLFRMDEGLDTGPLVAQRRVRLDGTEDALGLEAALMADAADLLDASLGPWIDGQIEEVPQPAEGATLTRPLRREDGRLLPGRDAAGLERAVRALRPWPGTFLEIDGERIIVLSADVAPSRPGDEPGRVVAHGRGLALATRDRRLVLTRVQPPGGRPMDGAAFRRGRPRIIDARAVGPSG